ncbi:hypothetical protein K469DRAFT_775386 [Zopfia rhizophila CBS 207.26]|uniref:Uncharacterized protein n=1 Tax=Zopfia rhizophila CBS 207.26 TaxID=1314779 RepID=A0A6A6E722_9PEZI|nr:hypothetical protein K469DRAFT_775386 [Zopfia rhizophila CBS 207.26]
MFFADGAAAAAAMSRVQWKAPSDDNTIPYTSVEEEPYVRSLVAEIINTEGVIESDKSTYYKCWAREHFEEWGAERNLSSHFGSSHTEFKDFVSKATYPTIMKYEKVETYAYNPAKIKN